MTRRLAKYLPLMFTFLLLAGCAPATTKIDPNSGIWDKYFVGPLSDVLDW
ncbi:MAG: rane protein, partial [Paenibacillus sp.]|nr:rane protein [Paenibacillus sp.]